MQATWGGNIHQFQQRAGSNIQPFANGGGLTIPYTFTPGTVADANEVNADFNAVAAWAGTHGSISMQTSTTLWVSPNGVDAPNNGTSPATPLATINYCWSVFQSLYKFGAPFGVGSPSLQAIIQLLPGTYPGATFSGVIPGQQAQYSVLLRGDENNPGAYVFTGAISCDHGALATVRGVTLTNPSPSTGPGGSCCLYANNGGMLQFGSVVFGDCNDHHIFGHIGGLIRTDAAPNNRYTIAGSASSHYNVQTGTIVMASTALGVAGSVPGPTITIAGNPNFSGAFAVARVLGAINIYAGTTYVNGGNVTGMQYDAHNLGAILNNNPTIPGNIPGVTSNGGIYTI